jgi:hypothetical protein
MRIALSVPLLVNYSYLTYLELKDIFSIVRRTLELTFSKLLGYTAFTS